MKKFSLLAIVVLALVLGAPAIVGFKVEDRYQLLIDRAQQRGLNITAHDYQRGWFSSTATTRFQSVKPGQAAGDGQSLGLTLVSTISHGPLVSTGLGLAEIDSDIEFSDQAIFAPDYPAQIHTLIELAGHGVTRIELPASENAGSTDLPHITFGGLSARISFSADQRDFDLNLVSKGLQIGDGDNKLVELGEAQLDSSTSTSASGLLLGGGELTIERFSVRDAETGGQVDIEGIAVDVQSSEASEQVAAAANYRIESIAVGEEHYGPGLLRVELDRLSAPQMVRLQQAMEEINRQSMSDAERGMALMGVVMTVAPELLKGDPSIAIKPLRLVTPEGTVDGELTLRGNGLTLADLSSVQSLAGKLVADLSLRMPEKLLRAMLVQQTRMKLEQQMALVVEQGGEVPDLDEEQLRQLIELRVDEQIDQWLLQEVVERVGSDLATVVSLSSGLLTVNGKTVPIPQ